MAWKYTKGMKLVDLLNYTKWDLEKMSRAELAEVNTRIAQAIKSGYERLKKQGLSRSSISMRIGADDFSVKGKTEFELMLQYVKLRDTSKNKTRTVKGTKQFLSKISKIVKNLESLNDEERKELFKLYEKFVESHPDSKYYPSEVVLTAVDEVFNKHKEARLSTEELFNLIEKQLEEFEEMYSKGRDDNDVFIF